MELTMLKEFKFL